MRICCFCGCELEDGVNRCVNCQGTDFMTRCNKCGGVFKDAGFCPNCGTKAGDKGKTCPRCSNVYFTPACPNCGYSPVNERYEQQLRQQSRPSTVIYSNPVNSYQPQRVNTLPPQSYVPVVNRKRACNKYVALTLCIFLGFLGAHKFYEEKTGLGILYLCTFGLFGFGWIIDILVTLFLPNPYYV